MLTVFSISHIVGVSFIFLTFVQVYLMFLPAYVNPVEGNIGLLVYVIALTEFNDVAQVGSSLLQITYLTVSLG